MKDLNCDERSDLSRMPGSEIVDIRLLTARELDPLLSDEMVDWREQLDWDFSKSAALVRKLAENQMLNGVALVDRGEVAGYGYTGLDEDKGVISDLYVRPRWRSGNAEVMLFRVLLDALIDVPGLRRVESQLMLAGSASAKVFQRDGRVRVFERFLMELDVNTPLPPKRPETIERFHIDGWGDHSRDQVANVIALAHAGHIDSEINDHYRTVAGARRFLDNLVQFPGSATFYAPASYLALHMTTGSAAGMTLSSFIADDVAHIAEICVVPDARGAGLGYELLRQSVATLSDAGAKRVSLTVTAGNQEAIRLYDRCGFREMRRFYAYAWDTAPRIEASA
jgi:ribosomal protein S18 acetylase RimI-like enzyme